MNTIYNHSTNTVVRRHVLNASAQQRADAAAIAAEAAWSRWERLCAAADEAERCAASLLRLDAALEYMRYLS
jgi:hypothetical protein